MKALQVWQYGLPSAAENGLDDAIATATRYGFDTLLIKGLDGLDWMAAFDPHPDALRSVDQVHEQCARAHAAGLQYYVWTNPRHDVDVDAEAELTGQLANACDGVFLDTEPYRQFWNNDAPAGQASHFMNVLRSVAPSAFVALQPDPRPGALAGIRVAEWVLGCSGIAGQHYWSTFGTDPRAELANAAALGVQFGLPVYPTLPGNANPLSVPTDLVAGFPGFVVWRLGTIAPAMLQVLGGIAPAAAPLPTNDARQTPDDYPFPDWRQSAIAYRGALDKVVPELESLRTQVAGQPDLAQKVMDLQTKIEAAQRDLAA